MGNSFNEPNFNNHYLFGYIEDVQRRACVVLDVHMFS